MADASLDPSGEPGATSRAWHWHPELPVGFAPYFAWPPRPVELARWFASKWLALSDRIAFVALAVLVYALFEPLRPESAALTILWVAETLVRNLVLILAVAGGLHLWLHGFKLQGMRLKYHPRDLQRSSVAFKFRNQIHDNMFWSIASGVTLWTGYELGYFWLLSNGFIAAISLSDGWLWFLLLFPLMAIWQSFHFYCIHRFLHWPKIYRAVHAVHHRNVNIGPWSGLSMHPAEHLLYLSSVSVHLLVPSHPIHVLFHLYWLTLGAVTSHAGYDGLWIKNKNRFALGSFFHQLHHQFFECNYGNFEMPWDRWLGTYHDGSERATAETRARMKRLRQR